MRRTITVRSELLGGTGIFVSDPTDIRLPYPETPVIEEGGLEVEGDPAAVDSTMVDISHLSLSALDTYVETHGDAALAPCLDRLMRQVDNPVASIGGHNS